MADFESMPLISFLDPYQVRTRDDLFRVVIERKLYDSHGSSRLDGSEYESGSGSSVLSSLGVGGSPVEDTQDTYSWSSRLGESLLQVSAESDFSVCIYSSIVSYH
jgi:hypothetical protein